MRILIHFLDQEVLEADTDSLHQERLLFVARPRGGNNRLAWISFANVKYIELPDAPASRVIGDPGELRGLGKIVLRFVDGQVIRAYKDDAFSQEGHCFNVQLWDEERGRLQRVVVSAHALKAIFFVEQWDSRSMAERPAGSEPIPLRRTTLAR